MFSAESPIGVIDSGVGGLTSVKEIINLFETVRTVFNL